MKKNLIVVFAFAFTFSALGKTLEEYKLDGNAVIDIPSINFAGKIIKANDVCVLGDSYQTISPVKVCLESDAQICRTFETRNGQVMESCRALGGDEEVAADVNSYVKGGCLKYDKLILTSSRIEYSKKCVQYKTVETANGHSHDVCIKYDTVSTLASDRFDISVFKESESNHSGYSLRKIASFNYQMPECE